MFASVLSIDAQRALAVLAKNQTISNGYLAGGSALALWYGHRHSVDFDFFSAETFDPHVLSRELTTLGRFKEDIARGISLIGQFEGIKCSYFHYPYPLVETPIKFCGISVAHPHDIAAMKLVAITDRGTKKDYIDLYELVQHKISLADMFGFYEKKYHKFEENHFTLLKALQYFDEADRSDMPDMIHTFSWDAVKRFFIAEAMRLGKQYIEER